MRPTSRKMAKVSDPCGNEAHCYIARLKGRDERSLSLDLMAYSVERVVTEENSHARKTGGRVQVPGAALREIKCRMAKVRIPESQVSRRCENLHPPGKRYMKNGAGP